MMDDSASPAERFILVHLMTAKMIAKRTTAITIGTAIATALTFWAEMIKKSKIYNVVILFFLEVE